MKLEELVRAAHDCEAYLGIATARSSLSAVLKTYKESRDRSEKHCG
jgi:hypothetical protein